MWTRWQGLRTLELGSAGAQRDELNALVVSGAKRGTAGLLEFDYQAEGEELERVGERLAVLDNAGDRLVDVEVTAVQVVPFAQVTWEFADSEGEGFTSVEHWGRAHAGFWAGMGWPVHEDTPVVCVSFELVSGPGSER